MSQEQLSQALALICSFIEIDIEEQEVDLLEPGILIAALAKLFPPAAKRFLGNIQKQKNQNNKWQIIVEFIEAEILKGQTFNFQQFSQHQIIQLYFIVAEYLNQALEEQQNNQYYKEREQILKRNDEKPEQKKPQKSKKEKSQNKQQKPSSKKIIQQQKPKALHKVLHIKDPFKQERLKNESKSKEKSKSKSQSKQKKSQSNLCKKVVKEMKKVQQQSMQQQLNKQVKQVIQQKKINKKNTKTNVLFRDEKSLQAVKAAKRKFDYYLKELKNTLAKTNSKSKRAEQKPKNQNDKLFLKGLEKKHKSIEEEMINEQIKYFLTLRDRKVAFVNKVHRLTQKLERERLVDWTHQQRQVMLNQREKVKQRIEKADSLFDKNMEILREQYREMKENKVKMQVDQHVVCHQLQKAVAKRKCQEIQLLKTLWQQQNSKLTNIIGDEQKIKNKLIDIYRKNRP